MKIMTHDPSEYIRGLQALLVSDKKKIGFLFGAGTSLCKSYGRCKFAFRKLESETATS
jgi:hypothetical protein